MRCASSATICMRWGCTICAAAFAQSGVRYKEIIAEWRETLDSGADIAAAQAQRAERMG
jgi:hypothetical protein